MGKINSRAKGARGERLWRDQIRAAGWEAERGQQFCGSKDSPDVKSNMGIHYEVKCVQSLNLEAACQQAIRDSDGQPWAVAHKKNGGPWRVTISSETFFSLCRDGLDGLKS